MSETSNNLLQVEIDGKKKQVYYDIDGTKLPVFIKEGGELFCRLSGGDIVDIKPHYNNKLYIVKDFVRKESEEICGLDPESLKTQTFYKYNGNFISCKKINNFQIQDNKVIANTQEITPTKLTKELIKQMKKEVEQLKKQYKEQQKAKQKTINTNYYTQLYEEPIEVDNETEIVETKALKLLKQIYNTNYKNSERGTVNHIFYNVSENINGNNYVFDITDENNEIKKIYFNNKSKTKELDNLMNACNDLIGKGVFQTDKHGVIL